MRTEDFIARLEHVRNSGSGHTARCPGHHDKQNSLGISTGDDGRILLKCYAGCDTVAIVSAMGLKMSDLMPDTDDRPRNNETPYRFVIGPMDVVEHVRIEDPKGKRFVWRRNGRSGLGGLKVKDVPLYRPEQHGEGTIVICEGEKAAIAAGKLGLNAYGTATGAASCPSSDVLRAACADKKVILWADNDDAGKEHMGRLRASLVGIAKATKLVFTGGPKDDAADFTGSMGDFKALVTSNTDKRVAVLADRVDDSITSLAKYSNGDFRDRVPTGINRIDYALRGGMMPGALYLLGAPSGHGKTTLLQGICSHAARIRGPVLFVSPEMSGAELAEREIVRESAISVNQVAPHKIADARIGAMLKLQDAGERIKSERLPVYVIEDPSATMSDIGEIAEGIDGIRLVIVDYAQEIAERTTTARYLAVGEVGKDAIVLGKKLNVPVLVASQVNVGKGDRGMPEYAFRETKDLEHRAHCSMIMEVKRYSDPNEFGFYDIESTRIFARKNRSGAIFSVPVDYNPSTFSIKGAVSDEY